MDDSDGENPREVDVEPRNRHICAYNRPPFHVQPLYVRTSGSIALTWSVEAQGIVWIDGF